jgi:hypothetical protein
MEVFPYGSRPGKGRKNKEVFLSTSLRRHDPDQVPGVEAYRLLSADVHSAPPVTQCLIANTSVSVCQTGNRWVDHKKLANFFPD